MKKNKKEILEIISSMSLVEIVELIDALEKKFGVSSSNYRPIDSIEKNEIKEEKKEFDFFLKSVGNNKIAVIKVVRNFLKLGLKDAKDLVESSPVLIKKNVIKNDVDILKKSLEDVGAIVEIK